VLVVGTRLGEVTSFLSPGLSPSVSWYHVDLDATAFGAAFPGLPGRGIVADADRFFRALHLRAQAVPGWFRSRVALGTEVTGAIAQVVEPAARLAPQTGDVRPRYLMQVLQERVVDGSDALVMSEAGTSFTWCNTCLRFSTPDRYRTSAAWGSMGHFTTGCVGAALVSERRVVTVVGDGAMLMNNELNTAVQYGARVVWIVLNDAQFGLNEHGMTALGMRPVETQLPRTDFVAFARSQGADGAHVHSELSLDEALTLALAAPGPFVLDVTLDRTVPSPVVAERIRNLNRQAQVPDRGT
jgi:acetolactate synthase I/II/III large subunit